MTTPQFVAQDDVNFDPIRYYTALDPYFYTVDNRPLTDIETNLKNTRKFGGDSSRRVIALEAISNGLIAAKAAMVPGSVRSMVGLEVSQTNSTTIQVAPGAVYEYRSINANNSDLMYKHALLAQTNTFTIPVPSTSGSQITTIEGKFVEFTLTGPTSQSPSSTQLPFVDLTNPYLASTLLNGELVLNINTTGVVATSGTEVAPATTSGYFPIYNITTTNGSSVATVTMHTSTNAPAMKGAFQHAIANTPSSGTSATNSIINDFSVWSHADAATQGVFLRNTVLADPNFNPYKPVKLKIIYSASATGNIVVRLRYKGFSTTDLNSTTKLITAFETIAAPATANLVQSFTTSTAIVPTKEFAAFVSGKWVVNKEYLAVILERVGTDGSDTNTGTFDVLGVALFQ